MTGISIELQNRPLQEQLTALVNRSANATDAMLSVGQLLESRIRRSFKDSSSPYGNSWAPVARGGKPLVDTGRLRSSITYVAGKDYVRIGTNVVYAAMHQFGGTVKNKARAQPTTKGGKFKSREKAGKGKRFTPVSFLGASEGKITARPFMPIRNNQVVLPPSWGNAVLARVIRHMEGRK